MSGTRRVSSPMVGLLRHWNQHAAPRASAMSMHTSTMLSMAHAVCRYESETGNDGMSWPSSEYLLWVRRN